MKSARQWPLAAVILTAAFFILDAAWIPLKAELAQYLMERTWQQVLQGNPDAKPWPWADTRPVAVLEVPRLGIRQLVLEGASGRNLAFGPTGLVPVTDQDLVISGHRDTHFSFLKDLVAGDVLRLTTTSGSKEFQVAWTEIIDSTKNDLVLQTALSRLTLTTCYPFNTLTAGGPMRYLVTAIPTVAGSG
jgi:sortase A